MASTKRRVLNADDLYRLERIADPRISPDGRHVVYSLHTIDRESEKERSSLWIVPTDRGPARRFTWGDHRDGSPRWSPNGDRIAFLSDRAGEGMALYVIPFSGGEARPVGGPEGSIRAIEWSRDGRRLACLIRPPDPDESPGGKDSGERKNTRTERRFTRMQYKSDGEGYTSDQRWHVWTIEVKSGRAAQVTEGNFDAGAPRWSPDGRRILFSANRAPDADIAPISNDLYVVDVAGGEAEMLPTPRGQKSAAVWSPDGSMIAWYGSVEPEEWWRDTRLWCMPSDGSAEAVDLMGDMGGCAGLDVLNDTAAGPQISAPAWSAGGARIVFHLGRNGATAVFEVPADGGALPAPVVEAEAAIGPFDLDASGERMVYLDARIDEPGQLLTLHRPSGRSRRLTRVNRWLERVILGPIESMWIEGSDGHPIQGWIVRPPGFDPKGATPAIIEIHGGPWAQYGFRFMHEFHLLAAHGYVVGFCNPRGGRGYGEAHARAIQDDWGNLDYADVLAWTEHVAAQPGVDSKRMGVTGGSYGGFMTNWIIGHSDRFTAAVTQRSVSNLISFWGSSDIGWLFTRPFAGKPPWEDFENLWRQSPMRWIASATTPTLVIHSEQDLRCDKEQGVQLYWALRTLGVDTELVLFPEESHGLSRGGRTDRRIARLGHILRWFDRYLQPPPGVPPN